MKIAKRFFHPMEYEALMQCRDAESLRKLFFRYWTLKESFMKATGLGFQLPLDSFCVILKGSGIGVEQSVDTRAYYFKELDLNDGYKYAVCSVDKPFDQILISPLTDLL